jgi:hypothetical protein
LTLKGWRFENIEEIQEELQGVMKVQSKVSSTSAFDN